MGVVAALVLHAAAFAFAARIELDFPVRAARGDADADEVMFTLDLRTTSVLDEPAEVPSAPVIADEQPAEAAPSTEPMDDGVIEELEIAHELASSDPLPEPIAPLPTPEIPMGPPVPSEVTAAAVETPKEFAPPIIESVAPPADPLALHVPASEVGGGALHSKGESPPGPKSTDGDGDASRSNGDPGANGSASSTTGATVLGAFATDMKALRLRSSPAPAYPPAAKRAGRTGSVTCRIVVARDGSVVSVEVVESSGHADLDEAAVAALKRWTFESLERVTEAARVSVLQKLKFQIERRAR